MSQQEEFTLGATVSLKGPYWTYPGSSTASHPRSVRASDKMSSACVAIAPLPERDTAVGGRDL